MLATLRLRFPGHRVIIRHLALSIVSFATHGDIEEERVPVGKGTLAAAATSSGCLSKAVGAGILDCGYYQ